MRNLKITKYHKGESSLEIPVIDSMRGLASLFVCLYHTICTTTGFIHTPWILSIFQYGQYGVHIFFVISGFIIPYSMLKSNYKINLIHRFIIKRFIRIEPPYIAAMLMALSYIYLREYIPGTAKVDLTPSMRDVLLHLGYLVPFVDNAKWLSDVFWTLAIEFQYYIILAFLFPFFTSKKMLSRFAVYAVFLILPVFLNQSRFFIYWAPIFLLGIIYCLYLFKKVNLLECVIVMILCFLYILVYINFTSFVFSSISILLIILIPEFKNKSIVFLGKISYSLYLVHCLSGVLCVNFFSHHANTPISKFLVISLGVMVSLLTAYIFYVLIEKPSKTLSQKFKLR